MDYWEALHVLSAGLFWLTVCLNLMMIVLLIVSRISPLRAIDVSQFLHFLLFAPISLILGAPSEVFAFMSLRPEEYKHSHSKIFFQYPFFRLMLLSVFMHGVPWSQVLWLLYSTSAYVANSWVPVHHIGVTDKHRYPRQEDEALEFPILFQVKPGHSGLGITLLKALSRGDKTRKLLTTILLIFNYFGFMEIQYSMIYIIFCSVTERVGFPVFEKYIGPFLSSYYEAKEGILCSFVYSIAEIVVLVCFIFIACSSVPDVLVVLANIVMTVVDLRTDVLGQYREDMRRLWRFQKATWPQLRAYNDVCAICLCVMRGGRVTSCGHVFHGQCLRRSLEARTTCPLCNARLIPFLPRN